MDADTLFINQTEIYEALNRLLINTKKDGSDRKTLALYRRKLETVETYWQEYLTNHNKLCESARDHIYFEKGCFATANGVYQTLKAIVERTTDQLSKTQQLGLSPRGPVLEHQPSPVASNNQHSVSQRQPDAETAQVRSGVSSQPEEIPRSMSVPPFRLDRLIKKQMINFKALERTVSRMQVEKFENKWHFENALKSLESRWGDIDKLHWEIEAENGGDDSDYQDEFCSQEEKYSELIEKINVKMWSVKHRESAAPQMSIPVFNGSYKSWVSFKDLFSEAIDKNPSISSAQKMQFLKGKVSGEAERLIHHLQISSENYQVCWEILSHRYGNKKLIFTSHINTLLGIPNMPQQSLPNMKKLHDVTKETLHAITNLGVDITTWDPLLVHLLAQKLDDETFTEYVESIKKPRELPSLQEFLDYLEMKFTALEASRRKQGLANQKPTTSKNCQHQEVKKGFNNRTSNSNFKDVTKSSASTCHVSSSPTCGLCNDEHGLWKCPQFLSMTSKEKLQKIKQLDLCNNCLVGHSKKQCQSKKRCRRCLKSHNTLLHDALVGEQSASASNNSDTLTQRGNVATKDNTMRSSNASWNDASEILLATAVIKITGANGIQHEMRALVDQGSQLSLINEKAAQVLGLKRSQFKGQIFGVGEKENNAKGFMDITIQSNHGDFSLCTSVVIMNSLIKRLPNNSFKTPTSWKHIQGLHLADPKFNVSRPVDLLLGADVYSKIMLGGILRGDKDDQPLAQQTQLGWLLCGTTKPHYHCNVVLNNTEDLLKFWENEDISQDIDMSNDDHECLQYFLKTTKRQADGRYEVRLPFKPALKEKLGATQPQALAQFRNLERKLKRNEELQVEYNKFMNEYINLNHMKLTTNDHKLGCYLPHHAVTRAESITTKLRVVFNASARSSTGYSLNDIMYKGPNIQKDLQKLILRWRQFKYAYTSDVEKMYRMIMVQEENQKIELHGFCDASNKAYACVIYCKITKDSRATVNLVAGKARLAPLSKRLSIPRLELMGAQLLTQLIHKVQSCLADREIETYCWTDSTAVLGWIQGDPARWKPFVANRVTSITKEIPGDHWRYVKTSENPADCASRGSTVKQLKNHSLWWKGPSWLQSQYIDQESLTKHETNLELKPSYMNNATQVLHHCEIINDLLTKFSSITKVIHIIAWALRMSSCKKQVRQPYLELQELRRAKLLIIKKVQRELFADDINSIDKHGKVHSKSKILNLNPFKDKEGIVRTGGRLRNANVSFDKKHPIILPHNHRLTTLLIEQAHQLTLHGGARLTLANLRQQYWIIGGYVATKMHVRRCVVCTRHNPVRHSQLMGDFPESRINPENAFHHCGLDYTGAVEVKANKGRGIKTTKGYIAVFVCMVTKAVHLEIVSELNSVAFLAALARMAARRGAPRHIYSDNGTNFVGANRMLKEEHNQLMQMLNGSFLTDVAEMGIQWHFNVPSWPNAGGLWERAVRSLKHHLKRVIGQQKLTYEEYTTLLAKIEACLNSRPLCALTEDTDDFDFLTPAHFLSGKPGTTIIETELDARTRWHMTSKLFLDLWKKWKSEYLVQLSARTKWMKPQKNIAIGELVVIHDENLPPGKWALGRVTDTHPGDDGLTRAVTLKTKNGIMKRPIVKLSVLPINQDKEPLKEQETQPETTIVNRRRSRTGTQLSLITTIAYFLLSLMMLLSCTYGSHEVKQLPSNQTLYFDPISKIQIIRDKWTVIVYYDMKPYWNGMNTYIEISNYLDKLCATIEKQSQCNTIVQQARHDYQEIEYYNDLLLAQQVYP